MKDLYLLEFQKMYDFCLVETLIIVQRINQFYYSIGNINFPQANFVLIIESYNQRKLPIHNCIFFTVLYSSDQSLI